MRFAKILSVLLFGLVAGVAPAMAEDFKEGVNYELVVPPQPTNTGDKVEVLELFWYGCPHCFRFEPFVERWLEKKPAQAEFVRMPAIFRAEWEPHARAYYTGQIMGVFDKVHRPLFNAIQQEKRTLDNETQLRDFYGEQGVNKDEFTKTYNSFAVETRVGRAKMMVGRYGIDGVPAVIVNGKYRVSAKTAGGNAEMLKVIDFLVAKESVKSK